MESSKNRGWIDRPLKAGLRASSRAIFDSDNITLFTCSMTVDFNLELNSSLLVTDCDILLIN